ncbi:CHAT domain-containing protein [Multifurca ochricompacta]|uniref:CHAT domain-containing protein n=1 Tax=Multifurca ochricompacta TaxID=376703 RepID=A0AAD4QRK8_9AGAM|nr:CHAT domain-containing protein [Multifurca ochricompacta]
MSEELSRSLKPVLPACPLSHPIRPHLLYNITSWEYINYDENSHPISYLDDIVSQFTEAILLPSRFLDGISLDVATAFTLLTHTLFRRFVRTRQLSDLECVIEFCRHLLSSGLLVKGIRAQFLMVLGVFLRALDYQTELAPSNDLEDAGWMVAVYRDFVTLDHSDELTPIAFPSIAISLSGKILGSGQSEHLVQMVEHTREAHKLPQLKDNLGLSALLALVLGMYSAFIGADNSQEIAALCDESLSLLPSGHGARHIAHLATWWLASLQLFVVSDVDAIEDGINSVRALLKTMPSGSRDRSICLFGLSDLLRRRYDYFGNEECLKEAKLCAEEAIFQHINRPEMVSLTEALAYSNNSGWMGALLSLRRADSLAATPEDNTVQGVAERYQAIFGTRGLDTTKGSDSNEVTDIEEVIRQCQVALSSTSGGHRDAVNMAIVLLQAHENHGHEELLDKSIDLCKSVVATHSRHRTRFTLLRLLGDALFNRGLSMNRMDDLSEAVAMFRAAFEDESAGAADRLSVTYPWALFSRTVGHPSTSVAYQNAMSVIQSSLVTGPTVQTQHTVMVDLGLCMRMPLEYASYQIETDQLEPALETLEQGRALLWSEMRGLRTSADQLRKVNPALADKFSAISQALEVITTSVSPREDTKTSLHATGDHAEIDPFSYALKEHRRLRQERDQVISEIQALPGFENFFRAFSFAALQDAASAGPVIIINHCHWRCDIIVILHDAPPSIITTPSDFYESANALGSRLLNARRMYLLESKQYDRALRSVLLELYNLVGQPVIDRLEELHIPKQSRIWWCPTAVFCSLPLHAMGPIPSKKKQKQYFSDLYVCSYTPSLSALITARTPTARTSSLSPSLLMVDLPDAKIQGAKKETEMIRASGVQVTDLVSEKATRATVMQGLREHNLVHFACHGQLEANNPFDTSFKLHSDRLTLLDIIRSRLEHPIAEFAFLAACHTAELTDVKHPDEMLHLTAAMQYCGFRSVVGTMWAMADLDGTDLSTLFYGNLFSSSGEDNDKSLFEKSARALRDAIQELRKKQGITLERWVNFVHYGA